MPNENFKVCKICKQELNISFFKKDKRMKDGLSNVCRPCDSIYQKEYYQKHKEHHKKQTSARRVKHILAVQQYLYDYLKCNGCIDCKESDPVVLEFDHISGDKIGNISDMVNHNFSLEKILLEIAKCEIRCANCHRRKTAKQFNWLANIKKDINFKGKL